MSRRPPGTRGGDGHPGEAAAGQGAGEHGIDSDASPRRRRRAEPTPIQRAIGLLSRREHSQRELTAKLEARGIEADEARAAVERLGAEGWQDDARFAESILRTRAGAGYGPVRIRAELAMHGLDEAMVAAALSGYEGDWLENARDLVRRRVGPLAERDLARRRKAADLLYRRGFESDHVRAALRPPDED